ncbi:hypothetical protein B7494_g5366 [Chlorociboria aeruginascens]|nr:hypothetical protein B7494_g5366 [Chlorociboria aeruginascens]
MDELVSSAPSTPRPRRPHHKSRTGCVQCKQRKVKCDEHKPTCSKCNTHAPIAVSPTPLIITTASNSPPLVSLTPPALPILTNAPVPANLPIPNFPFPPLSPPKSPPLSFSILDMEILHHWTILGASQFIDFDEGKTIFRKIYVRQLDVTLLRHSETVVPQLAFAHPFLMHQVLSLSALHLSQTRSSRNSLYRHASDTHLTTAISLFHPEIRNLTEKNCHACFIFSALMFTQAWAAQDPNRPSTLFFIPDSTSSGREKEQFDQMSWLKLQRGTQAILGSAITFLINGPFEPLWKPFDKAGGPTHIPPLDSEDEKQLDFLPQAWNNASSTLPAETRVLLDYSVATLKRVFGLLHTHAEISPLSAVISWFSMMPQEVEDMLEKKVPEALLVLAHYCVLVREVEHLSWMKGKGRNILETILAVLPPGWEEFTKWPVAKLGGSVDGNAQSHGGNTKTDTNPGEGGGGGGGGDGDDALVRGEETMSTSKMAPQPKVLFVLTSHDKLGDTGNPTGWYLPEFAHPYTVLEPHASITIASPKGGVAPLDPASVEPFEDDAVSVAFLREKEALWSQTERLEEFLGRAGEFDALFYVGGHGPMFDLATSTVSLQLISEFHAAGKVLAAVCHGPAAFVNAKTKDGKVLIEGHAVTGFSNSEEAAVGLVSAMPFSLEDRLEEATRGGYTPASDWAVNVVVSLQGKLITGQNPASAEGVGRAILRSIT